MPQLGVTEIIAVAAIALIVFGPERLPGIARSIGRFLADLRRMASEVRDEFEAGLEEQEDAEQDPEDSEAEPAPGSSRAS